MGASSLEKHSDGESAEQEQYGMGQLHHLGTVDAYATADSFDAKEESRLRLKMDLALIPLVSLLYLLAFIDRANIGNAKIAGLDKDLGLHGFDYNAALSVFYVSYILFEIPCNTLCKFIGPGWFIPATTLGFGILTICNAFVTDFSTLCAVRFLLGIFEAGMMPSLVLYLSRWYRQSELTFRVSLFIISASLAGAFGGLLASAILRLDNFGRLHSWRMIFAIEGIGTSVISAISFFLLPGGPETAMWLSPREKELAIRRLKSERIATTELVDQFSWNKIRLGIFNPVVLSTAVIFLFDCITVHGVSFFLPTIVKTIFPDHSVASQQLLTVPPYVVGAIACASTSYVSWRVNRRGIFMILCAPFSVLGYAMFLGSTHPGVRYGATFLPFLGIFTYGALTNSHVSANVVSDTARSSAIATNVMVGNIGGLISTWAFLSTDAPNYHIGNGLNLAAQTSICLIATGLYFWMKKDNKKRDAVDSVAVLRNKSAKEVVEMDWKHPDFRWKL
ncbi:hypothetical protein E4U43_000201 [Claviceps pusilla]|uniref:Major facilitator superfamily (MFS) profile domain-containing protein n=1 Tax=Claviceps pusilla TaxID=123648 RepID=A0A9P7SZA3_9HYPO|nr:hypothetical protein E4U43_000201 [Claviceps pusilla]